MSRRPNFTDFDVTDFVWNEDFRKWVLDPDFESNAFWNDWLRSNPDKKTTVYTAKNIISSVVIKEPQLSEREIASEVESTINKINRNQIEPHKKNGLRAILNSRYWQLGLTATVIIIISFSIISYRNKPRQTSITYQELVTSSTKALAENINLSTVTQTVLLPDGSNVVLDPGSKISYPKSFNNSDKRKIYLSGSALFDVAKNPSKPFLVCANGLITKVMGTKFIIRSVEADKKVSVEVISGIVSVYSYIDKTSNEETNGKKLNALVLTANQKANYSGEDKTLMATIVTNPAVLTPETTNFKFDDATIDSVFKVMKRAYGIDIIYDEKSLAKRTLTASLSTETMYAKMSIICKTINARYEVIDGKLVVYSNSN